MTLGAGTNLIVYAVGSLADETFTFYTQERHARASTPPPPSRRRHPGPDSCQHRRPDSPAGSNSLVLFAAAAGMFTARRWRCRPASPDRRRLIPSDPRHHDDSDDSAHGLRRSRPPVARPSGGRRSRGLGDIPHAAGRGGECSPQSPRSSSAAADWPSPECVPGRRRRRRSDVEAARPGAVARLLRSYDVGPGHPCRATSPQPPVHFRRARCDAGAGTAHLSPTYSGPRTPQCRRRSSPDRGRSG